MTNTTLFYKPAISRAYEAMHPRPSGSVGALALCERRLDCIQLASFGPPDELLGWLKNTICAQAAPCKARSALDGRAQLLGIGPGTWLLLSESGALSHFLSDTRATSQEFAAITDYSNGRWVALELSGPAAAQVLRMHLSIDLDEDYFAVGACAATGIHATPVIVLREAPETFLILVSRSFAVSLWEVLMDSASGYGVIISGGTER